MSAAALMYGANPLRLAALFGRLAAKRGILLLNFASHNHNPRSLKLIGLTATH